MSLWRSSNILYILQIKTFSDHSEAKVSLCCRIISMVFYGALLFHQLFVAVAYINYGCICNKHIWSAYDMCLFVLFPVPLWRHQNETRYKTYRNRLKRILYKAEKDYYSNLISANKSNMKKTWSILKGIINKKKSLQIQSRFKLNDGSVTTDKTIICEKFNNFFIGVGPTLANKIPQQSRTPSSYLGNSLINSMFLVPVSIEEITSMIQGLKNSAPGHDDITADALRLCLPSITSPLVYILNLSFWICLSFSRWIKNCKCYTFVRSWWSYVFR